MNTAHVNTKYTNDDLKEAEKALKEAEKRYNDIKAAISGQPKITTIRITAEPYKSPKQQANEVLLEEFKEYSGCADATLIEVTKKGIRFSANGKEEFIIWSKKAWEHYITTIQMKLELKRRERLHCQ